MANQNIEDIYRLSPVQQGMLYHSLSSPGTSMYCQQFLFTAGRIDPALFRQVWQQIVDANPALRTSFLWEGLDEPVQVVHREVELPVRVLDLRQLPAAQTESALQELLAADRLAGFDLASPPLTRLALILLDDDLVRVAWSNHHLILDGWAAVSAQNEATALYTANERGEAAEPIERRPFRDYIRWLKQQKLADAESYWRRVLAGFTGTTRLGIDRNPGAPPGPPELYGSRELRLSTAATAALTAFARSHRLTSNTVVQAAWGLALGRFAGTDDVVFGAAVSGRPPSIPGCEHILGCFINTLPVRIKATAGTPVKRWLAALQEDQVAMRSFEFSPLTEVHGWSELAPDEPLFDSLMAFENFGNRSSEASSVDIFQRTNYPLALVVEPKDERMVLRIGFDRGRFSGTDIQRLLRALEQLLEAIPRDPERPVTELVALTAAERHQLVVEFNEPRPDYPDPEEAEQPRVADMIAERAAAGPGGVPDAVAVVCEGESLTFGELEARANRLANRLRSLGVGPETIVGLALPRSPALVVGLLGILKSGGAYLPLDPELPDERLRTMLDDAQPADGGHGDPRVVVSAAQLLPRLEPAGVTVVSLLPEDAELAAASAEPPTPLGDLDNPAYVMYTSGSTGRPKGVVIPHRALSNRILWAVEADVSLPYRFLQKTTVSFDVSVHEILVPLVIGGRLILAQQGGQRDFGYLIDLAAAERATHIGFPPSACTVLLEQGKLQQADALRALFVAGEEVPADLPPRIHGQLPVEIFNRYGPTEATIGVTSWRCRRSDAGQAVPIGRPTNKARVHILDRHLRPAPIGVPGEILIGGPPLARGYLRRPARTAEAFVPDPLATAETAGAQGGGRLYKTGDLGRVLPSGAIEFLGRRDEQIKIRGFRVELGEIEALLTEHPGVAEAAVVDRGGQATSETARLVAYLGTGDTAGDRDSLPDAAELTRFLGQRLPSYMVPAAFVPLAALPRTPSQKIDRKALPAPGDEHLRDEQTAYLAPRSELEERIAAVWRSVLDVEQVGVEDDFFRIGGHSLLALRLIARLSKELDRELPLSTLIAHPTVASLAAALAAPRGTWSPLVPLAAGPPDDTAERPAALVLIHPAAGTVVPYRELAERLGRERAVFALEARGLTAGSEPHRELDRMAADYTAALTDAIPEGRVLLGGWSLGGHVAVEVARRLGARASGVILLDSSPLPRSPTARRHDEISGLLLLARELGGLSGKQLQLRRAELERISADRRLHTVLTRAWQLGAVPAGVDQAQVRRLAETFLANVEALSRFEPRPCAAPVVHYRAQVTVDYDADDWRPLAGGGLTVTGVGGSHYSMLRPPHVADLAAELAARLRALETGEEMAAVPAGEGA